MLYLDYSDTSVKVGPKNPRKIQYQSSEDLIRLLSPIIRGSKVAVLIPESDIFINRNHLITPSTDKSEMIQLILENSPLKEDEIVFSYKYIAQTKEILTYAMNREIYKTYLDLMHSCRATPDSFIPQSALVYEALRKKMAISDTVLFIDIGSISSELIVLDFYGPVCSFEEDIHEKNLQANLPRILTYIKDKYERGVTRIVLSGGGVHALQGKQNDFPLPTSVSSDYISVPHKFEEDALSYFNVLTLEMSYGALQQFNFLKDEPKITSPFLRQYILAIIGGIIFLSTLIFVINKEVQLRNPHIVSPVSKTAFSPSPTPTPMQLTIADITFEVLNGSGIEGQAQKVADLLKENEAIKVTTANAEKYTYVKTVIRIKKEFVSFGKEIEAILAKQFELDTIEVLDSDSATGVQIIVGR